MEDSCLIRLNTSLYFNVFISCLSVAFYKVKHGINCNFESYKKLSVNKLYTFIADDYCLIGLFKKKYHVVCILYIIEHLHFTS